METCRRNGCTLTFQAPVKSSGGDIAFVPMRFFRDGYTCTGVGYKYF